MNKCPLVIIQSAQEDFELVYGIILEASAWLKEKGINQWDPPYPVHRFREEIKKGEVFHFKNEAEIVGIVTLLRSKPEYYPEILWNNDTKAWYICRLAVKRKMSGRGLGIQILTVIEERAKSNQVQALRLDLVKSNHFLQGYYNRYGFKTVLEAESHGIPSIFMEKLI